MLSEIEKKYNLYKKIYKYSLSIKVNSENDEINEITKNLLINSLYLSVFTTFESFLKDLIENYISNKLKNKIKFTELSEGIAYSIFLKDEKKIKDIFDGRNNKKSFLNHFNSLKKDISKETLKAHVRFEFLHKNNLNGYYKDLFQEILGDKDFLNNLQLADNEEELKNKIDILIQEDAFKFLSDYVDNIRNNIAHQNEKFRMDTKYQFNKIVDNFYKIILEITEKYKYHTNFDLDINPGDNILDNF